MESQTKFVAISNQKGGIGKSAFTVLLASYFHYLKGKNVLVVAKGIFKSIINMDYIFTPIMPDRMAMQSSMSFVATVQNYINLTPGAPLKEIHVFWNRVNIIYYGYEK